MYGTLQLLNVCASRFSAALGAGLAILSRYPIIESHFYAYALNGHPLHFIQGDFFVGKAVGSCLLDVPSVGAVEVFSTHVSSPVLVRPSSTLIRPSCSFASPLTSC